MKSLEHQFADWVSKQDPSTEYSYGNVCGCAFAQFLLAGGFAKEPLVGSRDWYDDEGKRHPIPSRLWEWTDGRLGPLSAHPRTFGALAERLSTLTLGEPVGRRAA